MSIKGRVLGGFMVIAGISAALSMLFAPSAEAYVSVKGYTRKDGTYVAPYVRSNPNGLKSDNYGYKPSDGLYNKTYGTRGSTWDTPTSVTDPDYYIGKSIYDSTHSGGSSGTYVPAPSLPSTPSCPTGAYYDSSSANCKCLAGYVAMGTACAPGFTACTQKYGPYAQYDSVSKGCTCRTGYAWNADQTTCIDQTVSCRTQFGEGAYYDTSSSGCKCGAGSLFDSVLSRCVAGSLWCASKYGSHVAFDASTQQCACMRGYFFDQVSNGCIDGATYCKQTNGDKAEYNPLTNKCEWCNDGYVYDNGSCLPVPQPPPSYVPPAPQAGDSGAVSASPDAGGSPAPKVEDRKMPDCSPGTVLSFNGKRCVTIPEHAHATSGSRTDLWLCNDGYEEAGNTCRLPDRTFMSSVSRQPTAPAAPQPKLGKKTWLQNLAEWFRG